MSPTPRRICFMVMPFGKKKTDAPTGQGVAEIDFDALWDKAFKPAIEKLGYDSVRADQDVGSLIINEMLERLYFSDLVLADMTIPNGNVYYEVGVRHACRDIGCVLLAADWSRQLFDVAQMRTVRYPLAAMPIDDAAASRIQDVLVAGIQPMLEGLSPIYAVLPGFPTAVDPQRATVMRKEFEALTAFQARLSAVRAAPSDQQQALATQVMRECEGTPLPPLAAHSLLKLFEHLGAWQQIVDLAPRLPTDVAKQPSVTELTSLARSKLGNHLEAIAVLQTLIATSGPTSEREGLLGGRYKKLYAQASGADRRRYLNEAITHYERGMMLDLNDYYPSSNLPRLYRERGSKGDAEKAIGVAHVVYHACLRARQRNAADEFLLPTLLGSAFDAGDVDAAQSLLDEITTTDTSKWKLETTLPDLELSLSHGVDPDRQAALRALAAQLKQLL
jgi:tetratricopeptide (TPR) repeat protein